VSGRELGERARPQSVGRGSRPLPQPTPRVWPTRPGTGAHFGGRQVLSRVPFSRSCLLQPVLPAACWRAAAAGGVGRWRDHDSRGDAAIPTFQRLAAATPALPPQGARSNSVAAVSSECAPPCPHLLCEACCQGEGSLPDIPAEDSMPHGVLPRVFRVVYLGRQCFPGGVVESEYVGEGRCPREALPDTVSTSRIVGWDTGQGPMQQEARPRVFLSHFFVSL